MRWCTVTPHNHASSMSLPFFAGSSCSTAPRSQNFDKVILLSVVLARCVCLRVLFALWDGFCIRIFCSNLLWQDTCLRHKLITIIAILLVPFFIFLTFCFLHWTVLFFQPLRPFRNTFKHRWKSPCFQMTLNVITREFRSMCIITRFYRVIFLKTYLTLPLPPPPDFIWYDTGTSIKITFTRCPCMTLHDNVTWYDKK